MKKLMLFFAISTIVIGQLYSQSLTVTGTVTDEGGGPLPGVTVQAKGTTVATMSGSDGTYSIEVPEGSDILMFTYIGLATQEIEVTGDVINVIMTVGDTEIEEVIVQAYGTKGKTGLKGAITVVDSKELEQTPIASFDQVLQGKTSGVYIATGSGQPGTDETKILIRGNGSITGGNTPLFILDGVPIASNDYAAMNPNDFESVSVLKDASATSIYGSRASNGVIFITTKKGRKGKTKLNYRFQTGWSMKGAEKFEMMNTTEKLAFEEIAQRGSGWTLSPNNPANSALTQQQLAANAYSLDSLGGINTDWNDIFFRTGRTNSHEVNMSGGSEKSTFYTSFQYFTQEGIALRSDLERITGRFNFDHKITEKLRFSFSGMLGYTKNNGIESEAGIALANPFASVYLANPYEYPYDADGELIVGAGRTGGNALEMIQMSTDIDKTLKGVGALSLEYDIIKDLTIKTKYSADYRKLDNQRWIDPTSQAGLNVQGNQGSIDQYFSKRVEKTWTNTLDYKKEFGKHYFTALIGSEYIKYDYYNFEFTGYGLNNKLPETPEAITPGTATNGFIPEVEGDNSERALFSLFSLLNYTYAGKYGFVGSLRRDGSSRFGENNKFAILYSLGLIWNASEESFLKNVSWLDQLKLRVSYGTTGNQNGISNYEPLSTFGTASYAGIPGITLRRSGDPNIKWEIGKKFDIGLDFSFFKSRLSGTIDFYNDITSDLFITQTLSYTAGIPDDPGTTAVDPNRKSINAGEMRNRGIEVLLNADIIRTSNFVLSVNGNITYNQNEITSLGQVDEFELGTSIVKVGLPLGTHYYVSWAGVNPTNGEGLYYKKDGTVTNDFNEAEPLTDFGTSEPPIFGGFGLNANYKGIELGVFFSYAYGYYRSNNQVFFQQNPNFAQFNLYKEMKDMWQQPGDVTHIEGITSPKQFSSKGIEDSSFLRFRNLRLSYSIPSKIIERTKIFSGLRIYAQGQNLYTWTKYTGFDPEDSNNIATYEYPTPRTFTLGVDISF